MPEPCCVGGSILIVEIRHTDRARIAQRLWFQKRHLIYSWRHATQPTAKQSVYNISENLNKCRLMLVVGFAVAQHRQLAHTQHWHARQV